MVGVQDVHSVTAKQMQWLRRGGRKRLHELFKEMEERLQRLGVLGDFSGTIWLPTDVIVEACKEVKGGGVFWTFGEDEREEAERLAKQIRENNPDAVVQVTTARKYMGIRGNTIMTDFNWHGDEGAAAILNLVDEILEAVEVAGEAERLEVIRATDDGRLVRLPLFVPKLDESEMLEYAAEKCSVGDYVVFPGKRIFRRTKAGLTEASPADIVELTIL
jgi:hypothetical protein